VCFAFATVCMALSYIALALVREPPAVDAAERVTLRAYLSRMPALLGRDRNLSWYLGARAFAVVGSVGGGFYTVYALAAWDPPASQIGVFTTLMTLGRWRERGPRLARRPARSPPGDHHGPRRDASPATSWRSRRRASASSAWSSS